MTTIQADRATAGLDAAEPAIGLVATMIAGAAAVLVAACAVLNELVLAWVPGLTISAGTVSSIRRQQLVLLTAALALFALAWAVTRVPWLRRAAGWSRCPHLLLSGLVFAVPLFIGEVAATPFVVPDKTTIYIRDPELGWRHRPNASDYWDHQIVQINAKGLRGPALDYHKAAGVTRILYLGDSVTFGDGVANYAETFPYVMESLVGQQTHRPVETINAGVSGYSTWQEDLYLEREGIKYDPDTVVLTFVMNDVTEQFELRRFGGWSDGWQLGHTVEGPIDFLLSRSRLFTAAKQLRARLKYGSALQAGAQQQEVLDLRALIHQPQRADVQRAWRKVTADLDRLVAFCHDRRLPLVVVVAPHLSQFENGIPAYTAPQEVLRAYGRSRHVPVLDLIQPLVEATRRGGIPIEKLYLEFTHFSPRGHAVVASSLAEFLVHGGARSGDLRADGS